MELLAKTVDPVDPKHKRILVVDDEEGIRQVLGRLLKRNGDTCTLAASPSEARTHLKSEPYDVVLCDIMMPGESGMDLVKHIIDTYPQTATIMMTGMDDPRLAETALDLGAYGYITKPFKVSEVLINVSNVFRRCRLEKENKAHKELLEKTVVVRTEELEQTHAQLLRTMKGVIQTMALAIESRDPYTAGHQRGVSVLAGAIAREMGLSEDQQEGVQLAGLIHDLGKIAVPAEILSKPCRLTAMEFEIIKTHPQIGYNILKDIEFPWPLPQMVLQHHERIDGSGYPYGLKGSRILLQSRILGVADVMEAMASHRPYRPALGLDKAFEEMTAHRGSMYDSDVVDACEHVWKNGECGLEELRFVR